jgi:signal transduction histidine kinase
VEVPDRVENPALADDMAPSDTAKNRPAQPSRAALMAEIVALQARVDQLTASGHELISTQTRMQSLLHRASDGIIQFEADGTVSGFNRAAERIFDVAEIELLHRSPDHLFALPGKYAGNVPGYLLAYVRDTPDQYLEPLRGIRADGTIRLLEVSVAEIGSQALVLFDDFSDAADDADNGYEASLCILHDITERKQIDEELRRYREELEQLVDEQTAEIRDARDEAERANQAKSDFLASMSHELRTPMHAILSYSEFGQKKLGTAGLQRLGQYFERIQAAGTRLLGMIDDLLDLSKAEAGGQVYDIAEHDLEALVLAVMREYEGLADRHGVRLECCCRVDDRRAEFDAEKMGHVVRNLLSNAIKFSPEGGRVLVTLSDTDLGADVAGVEISIRDQGPGVPEDERESVFDKFVQGSRNSTSAVGTGLGLAIAREVVQAHRGTICVSNNTTAGSDFRFAIPRASLHGAG